MIWLALALPELPLQLAQRSLDQALARTLMIVIVDGPGQRAQVAHCNGQARAAGIAPGMSLAAAQALAHALVVLERSSTREQSALEDLACWAYQFSDRITPFASPAGCGLLMETGASERLFGGRNRLRRRITGKLHDLGYHAADAAAATPAAARVLALARIHALMPPDALQVNELPHALSGLPLHLLGWEDPVLKTLQSLGLQTIGAVLSLPRAAFARRFGAGRLLELDRMLGKIADPQPAFAPPERFHARIELPADLAQAPQLLPALRHLLTLLEGFLRGRGAGATALVLRAHHGRQGACGHAPTPVALALAVPERDAQKLLHLFTERLARVHLPAAATELTLELERMAELVPASASFLPPAPATREHRTQTLQLTQILHARLGPQGVFQLEALADHRPEHAYRLVTPTGDAPATMPPVAAPVQRPLLILPLPRPLPTGGGSDALPQYGGPLALLAGPERIQAGWWDLGQSRRATVERDYFVARNGRGQTLWIYRELNAPRHWFLHGFFA